MWELPLHKNTETGMTGPEELEIAAWGKQKAPGKRFELLRCRAPVAFKATAFPD